MRRTAWRCGGPPLCPCHGQARLLTPRPNFATSPAATPAAWRYWPQCAGLRRWRGLGPRAITVGAAGCVLCATPTGLDTPLLQHVEPKRSDVVADWDFRGDIHAQHTLLSRPGGWACDCLCFECGCRSDQCGGRERSGGHHIAPPAGAVEEVGVAGAYEMLSRIRNRPLRLSLVSAVTPMNSIKCLESGGY